MPDPDCQVESHDNKGTPPQVEAITQPLPVTLKTVTSLIKIPVTATETDVYWISCLLTVAKLKEIGHINVLIKLIITSGCKKKK